MAESNSTKRNESSDLGDLLSRFQYMFPLTGLERRRAYVFFRGWLPTFALMCKQIDCILGEDKRDFGWTRIREKFGAPSLSYKMRGRARHVIHAHRPEEVTRIICAPAGSFDPAAVDIQEIVLRREVDLRQSCIVCGAKSTITNAPGPWASLCGKHRTGAFLEDVFRSSVWTAAEIREDLVS